MELSGDARLYQFAGQSRPFAGFLRHPALLDDPAYIPQWLGVCNETGDGLLINEFIRLEEIESQWPRFCARFDLPAEALPHDNVSAPRRRLRAGDLFAADEDRAIVRERFHDDFVWFGYDPAGPA